MSIALGVADYLLALVLVMGAVSVVALLELSRLVRPWQRVVCQKAIIA